MMPFVYLHAATTRVHVSPQLLSFSPVITGHSTDSCVSRSGSLPSASSEDAGSVHSTQTLPATSRCWQVMARRLLLPHIPGVKIRPVHSSVVTASHPCFLWFRFCWVHTRLHGSLSSLFFVWFRETSSFSPFSLCVSNRAPLEFPPFDETPTKFFPFSSVPCRRHITINT
jgi:hypothetical protein